MFTNKSRANDFLNPSNRRVKRLVFAPIVLLYIPALFLFFKTRKATFSVCIGCPVIGFYPWTITIGEPGYSELAIGAFEITLTLGLALVAAIAIYKNSIRLAQAFAITLSLSSLVLILKLYVTFERGTIANYRVVESAQSVVRPQTSQIREAEPQAPSIILPRPQLVQSPSEVPRGFVGSNGMILSPWSNAQVPSSGVISGTVLSRDAFTGQKYMAP